MKDARAVTKYRRISPRKARLAAGLIRSMEVEKALVQLQYAEMKGAHFLLKTLKSAIANAESVQGADRRFLMVKEVRVDPGPIIKRARPKNRGGRVPIKKRTSHLTVIVGTQHA